MSAPCGVCGEPADVVATIPMCGEQPRYSLCLTCWRDIEEAGYCDEVAAAEVEETP
jgi:hypothetical protein